jgi:hypothetical protein
LLAAPVVDAMHPLRVDLADFRIIVAFVTSHLREKGTLVRCSIDGVGVVYPP